MFIQPPLYFMMLIESVFENFLLHLRFSFLLSLPTCPHTFIGTPSYFSDQQGIEVSRQAGPSPSHGAN